MSLRSSASLHQLCDEMCWLMVTAKRIKGNVRHRKKGDIKDTRGTRGSGQGAKTGEEMPVNEQRGWKSRNSEA